MLQRVVMEKLPLMRLIDVSGTLFMIMYPNVSIYHGFYGQKSHRISIFESLKI